MCFLPHMASPTSPLRVFLPSATAGCTEKPATHKLAAKTVIRTECHPLRFMLSSLLGTDGASNRLGPEAYGPSLGASVPSRLGLANTRKALEVFRESATRLTRLPRYPSPRANLFQKPNKTTNGSPGA